jgi:hypothetical protein
VLHLIRDSFPLHLLCGLDIAGRLNNQCEFAVLGINDPVIELF